MGSDRLDKPAQDRGHQYSSQSCRRGTSPVVSAERINEVSLLKLLKTLEILDPLRKSFKPSMMNTSRLSDLDN